MSTKHTTGRISVKGTRLRADDYPGIDCLATMQVSNQPMWEQDARRLVACWNACEGISTKNLEDNLPVKDLATRYNAVLAQREELLKALRWVEHHPFAHSTKIMEVIGPALAMASTPAAPPAERLSG